jgi:hypothetical protein
MCVCVCLLSRFFFFVLMCDSHSLAFDLSWTNDLFACDTALNDHMRFEGYLCVSMSLVGR